MEKLFENERNLALFLVYFIPGFISLKIYDLLVPSACRDFSNSLFDAGMLRERLFVEGNSRTCYKLRMGKIHSEAGYPGISMTGQTIMPTGRTIL